MAAFNFPNSPSTNDTHTENGVQWKWNGSVWKRVETTGPAGAQGHQGVQGAGGATGPSGSMPSGTRMLFNQTNPPTGWTKDTSSTNRALRLVSGTVGTGGANTFTGKLNSSVTTSGGNPLALTLSTNQIPSHRHWISGAPKDDNNFSTAGTNTQEHGLYADAGSYSASDQNRSYGRNSAYTGGGQAHDHGFTQATVNLNVRYLDVIIASKD